MIEPDFDSHKIWAEAIQNAVAQVSDEQLANVANVITQTDLTLTAGNGGSAALASHMAQAILKPDYKSGGGRAAICLTDGVPTWSAHANDGGWDAALAEVARPFLDGSLRRTVIIFSSSGRSENVIRLALIAKQFKHSVIAFTGFDGEPLRSIAHIAIHINSHDYEVVEPTHCALLHRVQALLRRVG